ncbi:hypothetical protein [Trichothermofontia sp.]
MPQNAENRSGRYYDLSIAPTPVIPQTRSPSSEYRVIVHLARSIVD